MENRLDVGLTLLLLFGESVFFPPELKQSPMADGDLPMGMGLGWDGSQLWGQDGERADAKPEMTCF